MANYNTSRILPVAFSLIIIAVIIAVLVSLARVIFFPSSSTNTTTDVAKSALLSSLADRSVTMTVRGKIVADEDFRSYQIAISPNKRVLTTYKGYLSVPIKTVSLNNNIPSYEQFAYSLYRANLTKGIELTGENNDKRGVCWTGYIYDFKVLKSDAVVDELWTSSCSKKQGSLNANVSQLKTLFIDQIPEADSIIDKLW